MRPPKFHAPNRLVRPREPLGLFRVAHFAAISSPFQFHFDSDFVRGIVGMKTENSEMELNFDREAPFHDFENFRMCATGV